MLSRVKKVVHNNENLFPCNVKLHKYLNLPLLLMCDEFGRNKGK